MNNQAQIQKAITFLGKPTFINTRKRYRTWKWYAPAEQTVRKLEKLGISVHDYNSHKEGCPGYMRESVTIAGPLLLKLADFKVPAVKNPKPLSDGQLRRDLCAKIKRMPRTQLLSLHKRLGKHT